MKKENLNPRLLSGVAVIAVLAAAWGANSVQLGALEKALQADVDLKIAGFRADAAEAHEAQLEIASSTVVSKRYVFTGVVSGKAAIYVKHPEENAAHPIEGFEFFYEYDGERWRQTESGRCTSEECTLEGLRLIKALDKH